MADAKKIAQAVRDDAGDNDWAHLIDLIDDDGLECIVAAVLAQLSAAPDPDGRGVDG